VDGHNGQKRFRKKALQCLKYNELRYHIQRESIKKETFSFLFCKRVHGARMNRDTFLSLLFEFLCSLRAKGNAV
jgi:hypothetical protein